jgi:MTH538 TIR-like domain (DUF1863)
MNGLYNAIIAPVKRKVFVSYHHGGDQFFYNGLSLHFTEKLEIFEDQSLERAYDSENIDYVRWQIRQNHIAGSSCTLVLCGAHTHRRKFVDWEIKATLDKQHGLIGVWFCRPCRWRSMAVPETGEATGKSRFGLCDMAKLGSTECRKFDNGHSKVESLYPE